jgi:hypothetical protein
MCGKLNFLKLAISAKIAWYFSSCCSQRLERNVTNARLREFENGVLRTHTCDRRPEKTA